MEENGEKVCEDTYDYQDPLDDLPAPAEQEVYDFEESLVTHNRPIGVFWKKPATKVYEDNFGFSVNGYQPMIDYLDVKDHGGSANKSEIHLPFLEERCLNKYSSHKPFKNYENRDIDKYIAKGQKIRDQIRQNDAAGASNVHRRTHTNWSMTRKYVQRVKNSFVVDFRKLHIGKGENKEKRTPQKKIRAVLNFQPTFQPIMDILAIRGKLDHDHEMVARRERLKALDDQYEETLHKLARTVERINERADDVSHIVSPIGRIYRPDDLLNVTHDLVLNNRMRRQQDLHKLSCNVDALTDPSAHRYNPIPTAYSDLHEATKVNPTLIAIAQRNANAAVMARGSMNRPIVDVSDSYDETDELRRRYLPSSNPVDVDIDVPPRRPKKIREDLISDVQTRIINRAREMGGVSGESLRISNRARYMNTVSPRPDTEDVDYRVPPSRTERNIVNMAKSLAYTAKPVRRYDIDDEVDEPVSNINTNMTKTYCTREYERPVSQIPSDSNRVRNAAIKARTRNTLLGN